VFKRTWNQPHFLKRTASHSTKGSRSGRVDVLPPSAQMHLYDIAHQIADGNDRIERMAEERADLDAQFHKLSRLDAVRAKHATDLRTFAPSPEIEELRGRIAALDGLIASTRKHVGSLKSVIGDGQKVSFETAFVRMAKEQLPHDVYETLATQAALICGKANK
jgi:phage I-like protein